MRTIAAAWIVLVPVALCAQTPGAVVFSEIMWMGSSVSSADEWIELASRSDETVDLAGWAITRGSGDSESLMVRIEAGSLAPGQAFLIANYAADNSKSALAVTASLIDPGVSLANTKLMLRLYDGDPEAGGRLVDQADDGTGAPLAGNAKLKAAMVRIDLTGDGSLASSWATADQAAGWEAGATELGTPGSLGAGQAPSPVTAGSADDGTVVESASWGALKAENSDPGQSAK